MSKYEVKSVVCDYGVFEDNELKLICNSHANASKIKEILETDSDMSKPYVWQDQKIADLEAKLAESDAEIEKVEKTYIKQRDYYTKEFNEVIDQLKQQLAEKEEKLNSDWYKKCPRCGNPYGASQFPSKDENGKEIYVCSNCNEKELFYEPLIKQLEEQNDRLIKERDDANLKLAEKEKELAYMTKQAKKFNNEAQKYFEDACCNDSDDQDKISFAVAYLEIIKAFIIDKEFYFTGEDYSTVYVEDITEEIDNQIKQLKENQSEKTIHKR